jgi:hypothetical protein
MSKASLRRFNFSVHEPDWLWDRGSSLLTTLFSYLYAQKERLCHCGKRDMIFYQGNPHKKEEILSVPRDKFFCLLIFIVISW